MAAPTRASAWPSPTWSPTSAMNASMLPFPVEPKVTTCCARTVPVSVTIPVSAGNVTAPAARNGLSEARWRSRNATAPATRQANATAAETRIHLHRT